MEDGGWRMEDVGWRIHLKKRCAKNAVNFLCTAKIGDLRLMNFGTSTGLLFFVFEVLG